MINVLRLLTSKSVFVHYESENRENKQKMFFIFLVFRIIKSFFLFFVGQT